VRLRQGRMNDATVFSDDPVQMAAKWKAQGARRLHVVDLDGAFAGKPVNQHLVQEMVAEMGDVPVQIGGGIRSLDILEGYLVAGVAGAIVGTAGIESREFLAACAKLAPNKVWFGLDARAGRVATEGWDETSDLEATTLGVQAAELPLAGIVYTDIERDGMLSGVNWQATRELAEAAQRPVVASGGVTNLEDLSLLADAFASLQSLFAGVITGRAIYEGTLDLVAGQQLLDHYVS